MTDRPKTDGDRLIEDSLVGVVAQWQSDVGLSQSPWVQLPAAPSLFLSLCRFKGLWTVTTQIVLY